MNDDPSLVKTSLPFKEADPYTPQKSGGLLLQASCYDIIDLCYCCELPLGTRLTSRAVILAVSRRLL